MFYYIIDNTSLLDVVDEEVSRVADYAYAEDGTSLYDHVVITERDALALDRMIHDAVASVVARFRDVCAYSPTSGSTPQMRLAFYVPDFDEDANGDIAEDELSKYIAYSVTAQFLAQRHPASVPEYTERANAALQKAVITLKTRKAPLEQWT